MSARRYLVTGGCGFVGSCLVRKLLDNDAGEVRVLDDCSAGTPENLGSALERVEVSSIDIRDQDAVAAFIRDSQPEIVFHLAAMHFIPACDADPRKCIEVNVGGTQSVLDGCLAAGVDAVLLTSTAAVYAPSALAHTDDSALGPTDIYGLSKQWAEQLGELFHRRSGVPLAVARLFNVFGPRETNPHLIPAVIRQAQDGEELRLGNLSTKRDYVFVDDVAEALIDLAAGAKDLEFGSCNIGREDAVDGFQIVKAVGQLLGRDLRVFADPSRLRPSDRPILLSDCTRASSLLGWRAQTSLREGLRAAIAEPIAATVDLV